MEFEFERQAAKGEALPNGLDIADSCLYIALKNLYAMYRRGDISKSMAKEEKRTLIKNHSIDKSNIEFLSREALNLNKRIYNAAEAFKTQPNIENAQELYNAFFNLKSQTKGG